MRLLLIAYEFPPSPSPQSLRWTYLARELDALGHEIHVLTADLGGHTPGLPDLPASVTVHRSFAGPLRGLLAARRKQRERTHASAPTGEGGVSGMQPLRPPRNWKQRVSEAVQGAAEFVHFPDIRGEWRPWGRRRLHRLLDEIHPDLVISSHEPATTLELGLLARRRGLPWVADLGDPVLAGYTPRRWRDRALRLERAVCAEADLVTVTNPGAEALLRERHGSTGRIELITQGFYAGAHDSAAGSGGAEEIGLFEPDRLELLYTGSLYRFRRVDALLQALRVDPAIRLNLAAITIPERIMQAAAALPDQVRLLGFLPHRAAVALQRRADVLVNIANDDHSQVPGKIYEYLGSGRPILHLGDCNDPTAALVEQLGRGWVCSNKPDDLARQLETLACAHEGGTLGAGLSLEQHTVQEYSWQHIARRLDGLLHETAQRRG